MTNAGIHFPGHGIEAGRKVFTDEVLEQMGMHLARAHGRAGRNGSQSAHKLPVPGAADWRPAGRLHYTADSESGRRLLP